MPREKSGTSVQFGFTATADAPAPGAFAALGPGAGTFAVASMALVNEASSDHRKGRVSGLYFLAWGGGYFAGPLLADAFSLESVATALGVAAMLAACLQAWSAMARLRQVTAGQ